MSISSRVVKAVVARTFVMLLSTLWCEGEGIGCFARPIFRLRSVSTRSAQGLRRRYFIYEGSDTPGLPARGRRPRAQDAPKLTPPVCCVSILR